jgi:long-chain acyl-CoA synthetase
VREPEDDSVFGLPHDRKGETVVSAIEVGSDTTLEPDDVREFVIDRLAPYKHPRAVEIHTELPRTGSGKVERATLKERLSTKLNEDA